MADAGQFAMKREAVIETGGRFTVSRPSVMESGGWVTVPRPSVMESGGWVTMPRPSVTESGDRFTVNQRGWRSPGAPRIRHRAYGGKYEAARKPGWRKLWAARQARPAGGGRAVDLPDKGIFL